MLLRFPEPVPRISAEMVACPSAAGVFGASLHTEPPKLLGVEFMVWLEQTLLTPDVASLSFHSCVMSPLLSLVLCPKTWPWTVLLASSGRLCVRIVVVTRGPRYPRVCHRWSG